MRPLLEIGARLYGAAWEARRRAYALGMARPRSVPARVVSIGNLTWGGTGKTTLTLHLARRALRDHADVAVVCRRYRPGPGGRGDEELLYREALGNERVYAGTRKVELAEQAARDGRALILVDDGFSHWALERALDLVLLDGARPPGEERLLPAGRLREPWRALQRAEVVVISGLAQGQDPEPAMAAAHRLAPGALIAAGRHRLVRLRRWDGAEAPATGAAHVLTGTGNPESVGRTVREAGYDLLALEAVRDHHWFGRLEARAALERARRAGAVLVLTAKDAVRWPADAVDERLVVIEVGWEWIAGGERVEDRVLDAAPHGVAGEAGA